MLMGDRLRNLNGEAEVRWHRSGPALVRRPPMRAIERGVDLDGVEDGAIALEVRSYARERRRVLLGDAPSSRADPHRLSSTLQVSGKLQGRSAFPRSLSLRCLFGW